MASKSAAVLIDLSGTIHVEDVAIPGAVEAVKTLMTSPNYHVKFVTNTTKNDLFTPLSAAKSIITHRALRPMLMLEKSALEDFKDVNMTDPNAVVVGLAPSHFNYERLNEAFNLVINGAQLIAIHEGRYHMARNGLQLGPGPFVAALKYAADVEAEVVGKPQKSFFMGALDTLNCHSKTSDAVMIGDDVRDDVIGAINAGMRGILVKTGKYRPGDELQIPAEARNCVDSVVQAISLIEKGQVN